MPPSHWIYGNRGGWMERDYLLALVLEIYTGGLCACGQPRALAHHPDNDGWYDAKTAECMACAAQELATQGTDKNPYQPRPGEKVYTVYTRPESKPLPPQP